MKLIDSRRRRDIVDLILRVLEIRGIERLESYRLSILNDAMQLVGSENHPVMGILEPLVAEFSPETKAELDGLS